MLGEVSAQAAEPPPTSGNTVTLLLGLTAASLIFVIVGVWMVRGIRNLWVRTAAGTWGDPTDNGSSGYFCTQCGEPMPAGDRFCHICGAKVMERTQ